jgi:endonuclease YncB( thermonuclease family)
MRRMLAICCVLLLAAGGWIGTRPDAPATLLALVAVPEGPVLRGPVRVIDGDTLDMGGQRLRLHGVDAPERGGACLGADGRSHDCGRWATGAAGALIGGRVLDCRDLGERTHGRIVAACTLGGQDLGAALIAAGIVRACPRYARRHPHSRGYEALEARAIAARVGLHAGRTPEPASFCRPR